MAKMIGLGGLFFLCKDGDAARAWYTRVPGIEIDDFGGCSFSHAASAGVFPKGGAGHLGAVQGRERVFQAFKQ